MMFSQWSYIGWQNLNPLSHPYETLAPQARQARASGEILNYLLSRWSDILRMIIGFSWQIHGHKKLWNQILIITGFDTYFSFFFGSNPPRSLILSLMLNLLLRSTKKNKGNNFHTEIFSVKIFLLTFIVIILLLSLLLLSCKTVHFLLWLQFDVVKIYVVSKRMFFRRW